MTETNASKQSVGPRLRSYLAAFNPWHNIKLWGRNPKQDIIAGATVAIISIPMAMAFGVASGLGASTGIWGTVCGGLFVGIFGGATTGISGPTSPKVVQLALVMKDHTLQNGQPDLTFAFSLIFLSGLIVLAMGLLRIGRFIYYTPYSVVSGFMCGIGVILILLEINPFCGLPGAESLRDAIMQIPSTVANAHIEALLVSGTTLATVVLWDKFKPRSISWLPAPLVALGVGMGIAHGFSLHEIPHVEMTSQIPTLYWPDLSLFSSMIGPAFALAGLCAFDSLLTCLVCDNMTEDRHHSDRELFGQGIANMACGLVGGVTTATATMRSVANIKCGAKSSLSSVTMGVVMLTLMVGLGGFAQYVPMACLAGILMKIGIDILDYRVLPVLRRLPRNDMICFWAVLGLTLWADLLVAVGVGLAIAFVRFVQEMSDLYGPEVVSLEDDPTPWSGEEGLPDDFRRRVLTLHQEGPLFFGLSDAIFRTMERLVHYDAVIVRMSRVRYIDLSGAFLLEDLIEKANSLGTQVFLCGMTPHVRGVLEKVNALETVDPDCIVEDYEQAVAEVKRRFRAGAVRGAAKSRSSGNSADNLQPGTVCVDADAQ